MNSTNESETDKASESTISDGASGTTEIERKFLVAAVPDLTDLRAEGIIQGYITTESDSSEVRVRRKGKKFYQTIKGEGDLTRPEVEIELSKSQFDSLWGTTAGRRLEKDRYEISHEGETIELDVYKGALKGLVIAEVEFRTEQESNAFKVPEWFGREVTKEKEYKNRYLAMKGRPDAHAD